MKLKKKDKILKHHKHRYVVFMVSSIFFNSYTSLDDCPSELKHTHSNHLYVINGEICLKMSR
jgi:hypothetical protein